MSIPSKEIVVSDLEKYFRVKLLPIPGKRIMYWGNLDKTKKVIVCTPSSKLHAAGYGWIDLTTIQVAIMDNAEKDILAFRIEGNKVYCLNFSDLKKYLIPNALVNNKREGDHWKLRIWPDHIQVLGNPNRLQIEPNTFTVV